MIGVVRIVHGPRGAPETPHATIELLRFMAPFSIDRAFILFQYTTPYYFIR